MVKSINIGCSVNEGYARHLGVMLYSLLKNCSAPQRVCVYLMDGGISQTSKDRFNRLMRAYGASITYLIPDMILLKGLKIHRHLGIETYYRFALIEKAKFDKLLYLDGDMVIEGDVQKIYDRDIKTTLLYAVRDLGISSRKKKQLGIPSDKLYFNAGVLLINCKKWREQGITKKACDYMIQNPEKIDFADQDGLNAVLVGQWKELHPSWNFIAKVAYYPYVPFVEPTNASRKQLKSLVKKPQIIHYASFIKPWFFFDLIPYKKRYWIYLNESPWKGATYQDKSMIKFIQRYWKYLQAVNKNI